MKFMKNDQLDKNGFKFFLNFLTPLAKQFLLLLLLLISII